MNQPIHSNDDDWAELVSDGHVLAARIRWLQPWLIGLGLFILVAGFYLLAGVRPAESKRADTSTTEVDAARTPVIAAVAALPPVRMDGDTARALPNADELGKAVVPMILRELNKSGKLPADLTIREIASVSFWRAPWPNGTLVVTGSDELRLVGGIVNRSPPEGWPVPARWIGIFSKRDGTWRYATAATPDYFEVSGQPTVAPEQIPLTLAPALPLEN